MVTARCWIRKVQCLFGHFTNPIAERGRQLAKKAQGCSVLLARALARLGSRYEGYMKAVSKDTVSVFLVLVYGYGMVLARHVHRLSSVSPCN